MPGALIKQNLGINFQKGLDQKTDPFQVQPGNFLALVNSVFDKIGRLTKRNGFRKLKQLPSAATYATTFSGNLVAIGSTLEAYSSPTDSWVDRGALKPIKLATTPLVRSSTAQTQCDAAVADNGLVCVVFTDQIPAAGVNVATYKYAVLDSTTGQQVVNTTAISATSPPRVFYNGSYFLIVYGAASNNLKYIAISTVSLAVGSEAVLSTQLSPGSTVAWDGVVSGGSLFLAWNGTDGGGAIRMKSISQTLMQSATITFAAETASLMSLCVDSTGVTPVIWAFYYNTSGTLGKVLAIGPMLATVLPPTTVISSGTIVHLACAAQDDAITIFYEQSATYSYNSVRTDLLKKNTVTVGGVVGSPSTLIRGLGIASKAFIVDAVIYLLGAYESTFQPSYFLIDSAGNLCSKLAGSNGGGYVVEGIPAVSVIDGVAQIAYLYKDLIQAINTTQGVASAAGVYSQTGVNLASFTVGTSDVVTSEVGGALHLSGGLLWMYDGTNPVEHGFFLYPENVAATTATTGGTMAALKYFYYVTYEWADNAGNVHRSSPSIPTVADLSGSGTATNKVTLDIPTLRLTYKTNVKIVVYRWSTAQQSSYQATSLLIPTLNDKSVDSVQFVDISPDSSIVGNNLLYTTGGVLENICAPATGVITVFKNRLFLVDSEDENLLWYSKLIIEATPVEMTDLQTLFVSPTVGAQGNTGPIKCIFPMDDKLIIFKRSAIYFISGDGPDATGQNSTLSEPVFITATVGCSEPHSIVMTPSGVMFQSDKGIWLLDRSLQTSYIGAAVEGHNDEVVLSALVIPETNQVRFTLDSGVTLMYDYYVGQWGSFEGIPGISSTLYQNLHTFIDESGEAFQENPGGYLDGATPVLMSLESSWINLMGLQGLERAYFFQLLGTYLSPHKIVIDISYDYAPSPSQRATISPDNFSGTWGSDPVYGGAEVWGGGLSLEQWRVFFNIQKCQAFKIALSEVYDSAIGGSPGAGFTLSGLNLVVGAKKGFTTLKPTRSV